MTKGSGIWAHSGVRQHSRCCIDGHQRTGLCWRSAVGARRHARYGHHRARHGTGMTDARLGSPRDISAKSQPRAVAGFRGQLGYLTSSAHYRFTDIDPKNLAIGDD